MYAFIGVSAVIAFLVFLILSIVFIFKDKKRAKRFGIYAAASFVAIIVTMIADQFDKERHEREQQEQKDVAAAAKRRAHEALIEELRTNRVTIISEMKSLMAKGDFLSAYNQAKKFVELNDSELQDLASEALSKHKVKREKELLSQLKKSPSPDLELNLKLYRELAALSPDNQSYRQKSLQLQADVEARKKRQQEDEQRRLALFGEPPKQSPWDGSYYPVESYLKRVMNDPDSLKIDGCTKVYQIDKGWLVGCDYRGRNGFGGMVRQSNWFTIRKDQVVRMEDANAYRP